MPGSATLDITVGDQQATASLTLVSAPREVALGAGTRHCLAVREDGTVVAWGYDGFGQANVPLGLRARVP